MQVKVKQPPASFTPVTLEVVFDTPDELKAMLDLLLMYKSIPAVIYPNDQRSRRLLYGMMQQMFYAIEMKRGA